MNINNIDYPGTPQDSSEYSELDNIAKQLYSQIPGSSISSEHMNSAGVPVTFDDIKKMLFSDNAAFCNSISGISNSTIDNNNFFAGSPNSTSSSSLPGLFDLKNIRNDFPILNQKINGRDLIWFDNAATTQKPRQVIETLKNYYENDNSNIHRGAHTLAKRSTDRYEAAREKVQSFIGAKSKDEIIFLRGTTEAINLVAQSYGRKYIGEGDEILVTNLEHHSNIVPWQMLAQEKKAIIKVIPVNDNGDIMLEEYERLLNSKTKIVAVTHVSNSIGSIVPVETMVESAHKYGAKVLIDGAQSVPHFRVNMQKINPDFYVFSGHKLFGPTGIGVLYGKSELLKEMPPWQGGGSMIKYVSFDSTVYNDIPQKFEAGTNNIAGAIGLGAAIDYLNNINFEWASMYEQELMAYATNSLSSLNGLHQIGKSSHKIGVISFIIDDFKPEEVGKFLDQEGIAVRAGHHCAQPTMQRFNVTGTVRPSFSFYNTREEIDILVSSLKRMINRKTKKTLFDF